MLWLWFSPKRYAVNGVRRPPPSIQPRTEGNPTSNGATHCILSLLSFHFFLSFHQPRVLRKNQELIYGLTSAPNSESRLLASSVPVRRQRLVASLQACSDL